MPQISFEARGFYNEAVNYYRSPRYWRNLSFLLLVDGPVGPGIQRLQQALIHPAELAWITRLDLRSPQRIATFNFHHGVWRCTGPCCSPAPSQSLARHPQRVILLPSTMPFALINNRLVFNPLSVNQIVNAGIQGPTLPAHNAYVVAQLRPHVAIDESVAGRATRDQWTGLNIRELRGIWTWYNLVT